MRRASLGTIFRVVSLYNARGRLKQNPLLPQIFFNARQHTLLDPSSPSQISHHPHLFATMKTACVALAIMGSASAFIAPMSNVRTASR